MEEIKKIIALRRVQMCRKEVLAQITKRLPNNIRLNTLEQKLPEYSIDEILNAVSSLEKDDKIIVSNQENANVPGRIITRFKANNIFYELNEEVITIGGVEFPRIFNGDPGDPEDINVFVEALASYDSKIESRISTLTSELTQKYWANLATIFGLFVAIFALILKSSEPIIINYNVSHSDVFLYKAAQLAPLAIILFCFVVVLRFALKRF